MIDIGLLALPIVIAGYALEAYLDAADFGGFEGLGYAIVYIGISIVWVLVAGPVHEAVGYRRGATIGKAALGLRTQHLQLVTPTWGQAIARGMLISWPVAFGVILYAVPSLLYLAWLAWTASRDDLGRHWVDRVTGSIVLPRDAKVFDLSR